MKKVTFSTILIVTLFAGGCDSELTAGGIGLGAGLAASETMKGIEADLKAREEALIERYNQAVEAQAKSEVLERIESDIEQTALLRQGVEATKSIVSPGRPGDGAPTATEIGGLAAILISLGINGYQKWRSTQMKQTTKAIVKGIEEAEQEQNPKPASQVKDAIAQKMKDSGIYDRGDRLVRSLKALRS